MKWFGTDGIRDKAFQGPLSLSFLFHIGRALGNYLKKDCAIAHPCILIGRDTRYSGSLIQSQLCTGLLAESVSILDVGVLPTPMISVLTKNSSAHLGIIISASHNPAEDNGIKLIDHSGKKLALSEEERIESWIHQEFPPSFEGNGTFLPPPSPLAYTQVLQSFQFDNKKVVLDCAHGAFSFWGPRLLQESGLTVFPLFHEPNGYNINLHCGALAPEKACHKVLETQADLGICLDGDGDRALLIDEKGKIQDGDRLLAILGVFLQQQEQLPHHTVVSTIMSNFGLKHCFNQKQIHLVQTPVGDRHILQEMLTHGYLLGGEPSGHLIFGDHPSLTGDGLFTGLKILDIMARLKQPLSVLAEGMQVFPQILINVEVREKIPLESLPSFQSALHAVETRLQNEGRVVVRYSGTENVLRIMVEGGQFGSRPRTSTLLRKPRPRPP
jgi:phosphoglucosamine mutase